jgi:hypothetical protein
MRQKGFKAMPDVLDLAQQLIDRNIAPLHVVAGAFWYHDETPAHHFTTVVAPILESEYCLVLPSRDSFDENLAVSALNFVREHESCLSVETPLVILEGFTSRNGSLDCMAVLSPAAARQYEHEHELLSERSFVAFPIYRCELSGDETAELIDLIRHDFLPSLDWTRSPHPKVLMSFQNAKTGTRSSRTRPGLATMQNVLEEIEDLDGAEDSWILLVNYAAQQVRIEWAGDQFAIDLPGTERLCLGKAKLIPLVRDFLITGRTKVG